jgi:arsenite-transporting ATPase
MWKANQKENLVFIDEAFGELPVLQAPLFGGEITGIDKLRLLGNALYGDTNPAERMFDGVTHRIEKDEATGEYRLIVPLPFAQKEEMDMFRSRDEITLRVGPYRRNIVLPYALWELEISDAKFEKSALVVRFADKAKQPAKP